MRGFRAKNTPMTTTLPDPENDPNSLGARLTAKRRENPGSPVLLTGRDLHASPDLESAAIALLQRLAADASGPVALTVLSNAVIDLNPFAGLSAAESGEVENGLAGSLVSLLAPGEVVEWHTWPEHFVLLSTGAAEALDSRDLAPSNALQRLREAGGRLLVADSLFLRDPGKELFGREELEPHESRRPPSWGLLRLRLDDCLRHLPADGRPAWTKALSDSQSRCTSRIAGAAAWPAGWNRSSTPMTTA